MSLSIADFQKISAAMVGAGLVFFALACSARADGFPGTYAYKLVLRDKMGFVLSGTEESGELASSNYNIEVLNSKGEPVGSRLADVTSLGSNRETGCNCTLSVSVGEGTGCATVGEQLTLVVTTKYDGTKLPDDRSKRNMILFNFQFAKGIKL